MPQTRQGVFETIFNTIDIFNERSHLFLQKKRTLPTTLGGLLTIGLIVFIVVTISADFYDMFHYQNPKLYRINELEDNPSMISLDKNNNFFFAVQFMVNDVPQNLSENSPFNPQTYIMNYTRHPDGSRTHTEFLVLWAPCQVSDFPEDLFGETFANNNFDLAYCMTGINWTDPTDGSCPNAYPDCISPPNIDIQGTYSTQHFAYSQTNLKICDPNDDTLPATMVCETEDVIQMFADGNIFKINIYYSYNLINPHNYYLPNKTVIDNTYYNLNPKIFKVADIFVHKSTLQDFDDHWSSSHDTNHTFYTIPIESIRQLERMQTGTLTTLFQMNIRRSSTNKVQARNYAKVTQILTDLGGFTKTIMFLSAFIAIGFVRYKYLMIVGNELFDFQFSQPPANDKEQEPEPEENNTKKIFLSSMDSMDFSDTKAFAFSPKSFTSPREAEKNKADKVILNYSKMLETRKKKLAVSEWSYLKEALSFLCCRKSEESKFGDKARKLAFKSLDIIPIVQKLHEFERLKTLLLNKKQRDAFVFIEKPLITVHSKKPLYSNSLTNSIRATQKTYNKKADKNAKNPSLFNFEETQQASIENIFEREKSSVENYQNLHKYGNLYMAYRYLKQDTDPSNELFNRKLLGMLNPELVKVFKKIGPLMEDEPSANQFASVIKNFTEPKTLVFTSK